MEDIIHRVRAAHHSRVRRAVYFARVSVLPTTTSMALVCLHPNLRVASKRHVEAVNVVRIFRYAVRLSHEKIDEGVREHVVSCLAHHSYRRLHLILAALQKKLESTVVLSA